MSSSSLPLQSAAAKAATQTKATAGGAVTDRVSSVSFPSSVWADGFLDKIDLSLQAKERHPKYEVMMEDVRKMVVNEAKSPTGDDEAVIADKLRVIDAVQRLGVGYHFEAEIEEALEKVHDKGEGLFTNIDHKRTDLYHAALRFRLLRQQGFPVSIDGFAKLKNSEGRFKEWFARDEKGLLSLYEAANIAFNGEDILEESLSFTTNTLKSALPTLSPSFQKQVNFALRLPAWKCVPRSLARHSIDFYEEDANSSLQNRKLLAFAKLDFNMVQCFHQQELHELTLWYRSIDVATNFPYARDRIVESYYWIICYYFEPKYRLARIINTKIMMVLSILDDTCDNFATYEEVRALAEAIQTLDLGALRDLPDRMKNVYRVIVDLYDEIETEMRKIESSFAVEYAKKELKRVAECYLREIWWRNERRVPTLEEYMSFAYDTGSIPFLCTSALVGKGAEVATREAFEWVTSDSKMMKAAASISRLQNDIFSHEFEQERDHAASSVECYMEQYGATREEAIEFLWKKISKAWRDIAEECQKPAQKLPVAVTERLLNLARSINMFYDNDDCYTNSHLLKDHLTSLFIHPVPL